MKVIKSCWLKIIMFYVLNTKFILVQYCFVLSSFSAIKDSHPIRSCLLLVVIKSLQLTLQILMKDGFAHHVDLYHDLWYKQGYVSIFIVRNVWLLF